VPTALRWLTHKYVFIGSGLVFAVGIALGLVSGILFDSGLNTAGGPKQANEAADDARDETGATATPSAAVGTPTPEIKRFTTVPALTIDPAKSYSATIKTTQGDITIKLDPNSSPDAVNAFVFLANQQYYNGTVFMQVNPEAPKFTAQAGDPTQTGLGTPGFNINEKPTDLPFVKGAVGYDSGQFYISYQDAPALNGKETIIGNVTSGLDVLEKLNLLNVRQKTGSPDKITSVTITES
jgi:cyclophilin family peptidyl-prolyl cis-trans isomerase